MRFAILVVWKDGTEEYLLEGTRLAVFSSKSRAQDQADFMAMGMDDVQSINVVKARRWLVGDAPANVGRAKRNARAGIPQGEAGQ